MESAYCLKEQDLVPLEGCGRFDGTMYLCQTCGHPRRTRSNGLEVFPPGKEPVPPAVLPPPHGLERRVPQIAPAAGASRESSPLSSCRYCKEPIGPEEAHPLRRGWHSRCAAEHMRKGLKTKKSIPAHRKPEPLKSEEPVDKPETVQAMKSCEDCGTEFREYLWGGKSRPNCCFECLKRRQRAAVRERWLRGFEEEGLLILDLTCIKELIPAIREDAKANLRTFPAQCLWYLVEKARKLGE